MKNTVKSILLFTLITNFINVELAFSQGNTDSIIAPTTIFILQDFVDNFEQGLNAGGSYIGFGEDRTMGIELETDANFVQAGNASGRLETDDDGFNSSGEFIGVSKAFSLPIDAGSFNSINYWARAADTVNPPSVQLEFIIGAGGEIPGDDTTTGNGGSVWTQIVGVELSDSYQRIVRRLNDSDFERTVSPAVTSGDSGSFDLGNITAINLVFRKNPADTGGTKKIMYFDDIIFFNNPRSLTVTQSSVFEPADGVQTVTIIATVQDNGGIPAESIPIEFILVNGNGSLGCTNPVDTNITTGVAECIYTVGTAADIAEILVQEQ